jgi:hypothetical protein
MSRTLRINLLQRLECIALNIAPRKACEAGKFVSTIYLIRCISPFAESSLHRFYSVPIAVLKLYS